jgi:cysteine dioxygenase
MQEAVAMTPFLKEVFLSLDEFPEQVPLDVLAGRLRGLDFALDDLRPYVRFADERYQRNLVYRGRAYEALLLCWKAGQRSPIHDHRGSACAFRVIEGTASETRFHRTSEGLIFPLGTNELRPGTICATFDNDIHQVSNLQPRGMPLITLHIYSPALRICNVFSLTEAGSYEWMDPVFEFAEGAGI